MKLTNSSDNSAAAIIVAGGKGTRMGLDIPKQFIKLSGREILLHTLDKFLSCDFIGEIIVVCHDSYVDFCKELFKGIAFNISVVPGGATRQESVYHGLMEVKCSEYVFIHDAVRPLVNVQDIKKLMSELKNTSAVALAVRAKDTIKIADSSNKVISTPDRSTLWQIQTPQAFFTNDIIKAHEHAINSSFEGTDDCSLMEYYGGEVKLVEGSYENIKITTASDLEIARLFMKGGREV